MRVKLDKVKVTAISDGGLSLQPDPAKRCTYPVFSIEVAASSPLTYSCCRRSEKNTSSETMKIPIKCTPHKYTPKCSAKSVTAPVTQTPKCPRRYHPYAPPSHGSPFSNSTNRPRLRRLLCYTPATQHSTYSTPNSQILISVTSLGTELLTAKMSALQKPL